MSNSVSDNTCTMEIYCCLDDEEGEDGDPNKDFKS